MTRSVALISPALSHPPLVAHTLSDHSCKKVSPCTFFLRRHCKKFFSTFRKEERENRRITLQCRETHRAMSEGEHLDAHFCPMPWMHKATQGPGVHGRQAREVPRVFRDRVD